MPDGAFALVDETRENAQPVQVATVTGAHGVRGLVRVKSHTAEPEAVTAYGPLTDSAGQAVELEIVGESRGQFLARLAGVATREAADRWRGEPLFVARDQLPEPEEEAFYHADLIGLTAVGADGEPLGVVRAIFDFGAGDVLEIETADGDTRYVPFTREAVPSVEPAAGRLVVSPPVEVGEPEPSAPEPVETAADAVSDADAAEDGEGDGEDGR